MSFFLLKEEFDGDYECMKWGTDYLEDNEDYLEDNTKWFVFGEYLTFQDIPKYDQEDIILNSKHLSEKKIAEYRNSIHSHIPVEYPF